MEKTNEDILREKVNNLFAAHQINHATWCNALHYIDGDYKRHAHKLCRDAFMRCKDLFHLAS